jgi:hypothetical protein
VTVPAGAKIYTAGVWPWVLPTRAFGSDHRDQRYRSIVRSCDRDKLRATNLGHVGDLCAFNNRSIRVEDPQARDRLVVKSARDVWLRDSNREQRVEGWWVLHVRRPTAATMDGGAAMELSGAVCLACACGWLHTQQRGVGCVTGASFVGLASNKRLSAVVR